MSETKHTPWKLEGAGLGARTNFVYEDRDLIGLFYKSFHADRCIQAVNARPKVEELVKAAKACVPIAENAGLGPPGPTSDQEDVKRLERAIREVEAALGGKAE